LSLGEPLRVATSVSGRHLGNFPQAFTHLALIDAVVHLIRLDEQLSGQTMTAPAPGLTVEPVS
jgi:alpha,alpha-trehalase